MEWVNITDVAVLIRVSATYYFSRAHLILIVKMETKLTLITKWLTDSGLKVNQTKTELCQFHRRDTPAVEIRVDNTIIKSKDNMNVLGDIFDSKLTWTKHIATK